MGGDPVAELASGHDALGLGVERVGPAFEWGEYRPAIERWERLLGRAAPYPLARTDGRGGLSPAFVEWMMGLPEGWTSGLKPKQALVALGNAVVPQAAAAAAVMLGLARK